MAKFSKFLLGFILLTSFFLFRGKITNMIEFQDNTISSVKKPNDEIKLKKNISKDNNSLPISSSSFQLIEPINTLEENNLITNDEIDHLEEHELAPIVSEKSKLIIDDIILKVGNEIDQELYGSIGSESYNIVLLFYQSLKAYRSFLLKPDTGPDFYILYHQDFSGRYHYNNGVIALGSYVIQEGESRFLVTLFHEYQHHLFHTIYGTPEYHDIVGKFYNELSAYIFEFLLASYMPYEAYQPHRGRIPYITKTYLQQGRVRDLYEMVMKMMLPQSDQAKPIYGFLLPIVQEVVSIDDVLNGISKDFHPDSIIADELKYEIKEERNDRNN